ncbi:voltage-gated chloride channel family protein [Limnohabitans sp. Rim8]|uniref:voltage-gated chloride channel family protein n=1 Tax=Limnohabitans sp. Rim8 TaxID=1100718 RepID=UPI003305B7D8
MPLRRPLTFAKVLAFTTRWLLLCAAVAIVAGSASALFLFALDWATRTRTLQPGLIWGLPLAGFAMGWIYLKWGKSVDAGHNLLIDEINAPIQTVPLRMAPMILGSTVISHLFGASVGREGTAVQMGGSLADQLTSIFKLSPTYRQVVLMAGISAGFASVFGTPLAGALFALEVLAGPALLRMRWIALPPCIVAAFAADQVGLWWGVQHTVYTVSAIPTLTAWGLASVVLAGGVFGLTGRVFAWSAHTLSAQFKQWVAYPPLRPLIGGVLITAFVVWGHAERYIGLGIPVILEAFDQPLAPWDFAAKLAMTVLSLGSGFKGGEVTPLFYIGATLGNALAPIVDMPLGLMAALGFVAVFAGASNTPLACTLMAIELFGFQTGAFAAVACTVSYFFSGHTSIYKAQRHAKKPWLAPRERRP